MSFLITTCCLAIAALTSVFILKHMEAAKPPSTSDRDSNLLAQKQKLIESLREIEFDRKMEKLSVDDYEKLKLHTHRELSEVLKELDSHA